MNTFPNCTEKLQVTIFKNKYSVLIFFACKISKKIVLLNYVGVPTFNKAKIFKFVAWFGTNFH